MKVGLLWYDADARRSSRTKVDEAAQRYLDKFGVYPDTCHVNPGDSLVHDVLRIVPNRWIRPNYYWIGIDDEATSPRDRSSADATLPVCAGASQRARGKKAG